MLRIRFHKNNFVYKGNNFILSSLWELNELFSKIELFYIKIGANNNYLIT